MCVCVSTMTYTPPNGVCVCVCVCVCLCVCWQAGVRERNHVKTVVYGGCLYRCACVGA